jgi:hypothetical protein
MQRSPDVKEDSPKKEENPSAVSTSETSVVDKKPRKYHNGWTKQLENLVAEWADKASCYQWMHGKTEEKFSKMNYYFTIPVIIMSTLTGTANFATNSIVSTEEQAKYVTFGIGAISLIAGIISTVANFLRYAQGSEAHRVAAISWGKFQRFISIELSLHPNERMDAMSFLKMGRIELDRLIEQSPPIPPKIVEAFMVAFREKKDIVRPEIAGGIEHTRIFEDRDSRLAKIASEAAYIIQQKKGLMRQLVLDDIDKRILSKTREEREAMEEQLREEIMQIARDAAVQALKNPTIPYQNKVQFFNSAREEAVSVIPEGTLQKTKEKLKEATIVPGPSSKLRTRSDLAAQAAAAALSKQKAPLSPSHSDEGPSSIRLEIIDEGAELGEESYEKK